MRSHIVICHQHSTPGSVPQLRPPGWKPDAPNPGRGEQEALRIAEDIATQAQRDPDQFATLARRYSDDLVTRDAAGSLGGVRATQLPGQYLDALAVLRPGEVSLVLQTGWGFHVLMRRRPPDAKAVAGKHIVIRYDGTFGGDPGVESSRTRDNALTLARSLAQRARSGRESSKIVRSYSDNPDRVQTGDIGLWALDEPADEPRELEELGRLDAGAISNPLESQLGFEILERTEATNRPRFAMQTVQIKFDATKPDSDEQSKASALTLARSLALQLHSDPASFDLLRQRLLHGAPDVDTRARSRRREPARRAPGYQRGRVRADCLRMVLLHPEEIDAAIVQGPEPTLLELPTPNAPNLDAMVLYGTGRGLAARTRAMAKLAVSALAFGAEQTAEMSRLLEALAAYFEKNAGPQEGPGRVERMHATLDSLRVALGQAGFDQFQSFLLSWAREGLMRSRR